MSKTSTYLLLAPGTGLVKIGCSDNPVARLRRLRTLNAARVEILVILDKDEAELHTRFKKLRHHGEWFRVDQLIANYLDTIEEYDAADRIMKEVNNV